MGHLRQRGRDDGGIQILHEERSRDYVRQPASGRGCWRRTAAHEEFQVERRRRIEQRAIVEIDTIASWINPALTYALAQAPAAFASCQICGWMRPNPPRIIA